MKKNLEQSKEIFFALPTNTIGGVSYYIFPSKSGKTFQVFCYESDGGIAGEDYKPEAFYLKGFRTEKGVIKYLRHLEEKYAYIAYKGCLGETYRPIKDISFKG